MHISRLNLSALRSRRLPCTDQASIPSDLLSEEALLVLNRREMLGMMGFLGAIPVVNSVGTTVLGSVTMVASKHQVVFRMRGKDRWVIDTKKFGGNPKIQMNRTAEELTVELQGATYPGTEIAADFTCRLTPSVKGWRMHLRMAHGFEDEGPFESWLLQMRRASAVVSLNNRLHFVSGKGSFQLKGKASSTFWPDWTLEFKNPHIARVNLPESKLSADTVTLQLLDKEAPSLLNRSIKRRSLLSLKRGDRTWSLTPALTQEAAWDFQAADNLFDSLLLEVGESRRGRAYQAIVLESRAEDTLLHVKPSPDLTEFDGQSISLPLSKPVYAIALNEAGNHAALRASFGANPSWIHLEQHSLLVGDDGENPAFEMTALNGRLEQLSCKPALLSTIVPPRNPDIIVHPIPTEPGTQIELSTSRRLKAPETSKNLLHVKAGALTNRPTLFLADLKVQMIRPEDFLTLGFEFFNVQLQDGGSGELGLAVEGATPTGPGPKLIAGNNAYMVVHFPPQNIAEQAFQEEENPVEPDPPPVQARMAGQSRIAYRIPAGTAIMYTLEGLLQACSDLDMNLAPNARAPEIRPLYVALGFQDLTLNFNGAPQGTTPLLPVMEAVPALKGVVKQLRTHGNAELKQQLDRDFGQVRTTRGQRANTNEPRFDKARRLIAERNERLIAQTSPLAIAVAKHAETIDGALSITSSGTRNGVTAGPVNANNIAVQGAVLATKPSPRPPTAVETAIEAPFRMYISPNEYAAWTHATQPKSSEQTGHTELWHSRLGIRYRGEISEEDFDMKSIRAIWHEAGGNPFNELSLEPNQRRDIVHLSSDFSISGYTPRPVKAHQLMLSSLGAWIHVRGKWPEDAPYDVSEWIHRGTLGRDHYVKVVEKGVLFPFGHRAALINITERKFQPHPQDPDATVAYLRKRTFIVVKEPDRITGIAGTVEEKRKMPFKRAQIVTLVTPLLDSTGGASIFWPQVGGKDFLFNMKLEDTNGVVHEITKPLAFIKSSVIDGLGGEPGAIISNGGLTFSTLRSDYNSEAGEDEARNKRFFNGQSVSYTPSAIPGDTSFETADIEFNAIRVDSEPFFTPVLVKANVVVPAVRHLLGSNASSDATGIEFASEYLTNGFEGSNSTAELFFKFTGSLGVNFSGKGEQSGGLVQPNMDVKVFSRKSGPVGGDASAVTGENFDAAKFFDVGGSTENIPVPMLFGVISLWDIIGVTKMDELDRIPKVITESLDAVEFFIKDAAYFIDVLENDLSSAVGAQLNNLVSDLNGIMDAIEDGDTGALPDPGAVVGHIDALLAALPGSGLNLGLIKDTEKRLRKFRELLDDASGFLELITNFLNAVEMAKEMKVRLEWRPHIKNLDPIFIAENNGKPASMVLGVELRAKSPDGSGGQPSADIFCSLDNFTIDLYVIAAHFERIQFFASTGQKMGIDVVFDDIEFKEILSWVEKLRDLIPLDGFSDPPYIDIDGQGITAGFTLPIPSIAMGVFTIQNLSLGAELNLPFIGDPATINFNFNTREDPCTVTVMAIGGSFYFGLTLDMEGLRSVEAAIEFGASIAFNIAVASGGVSLMAGIYFKYDKDDGVTLTGYLRISGYVSVLGLISISLELRMELTYESAGGGKVKGRATITVEIEVLFFSFGVEITVERKFAGSNGDPTFLEQMGSSYIDPVQDQTVEAWPEYCMAFAD